MDVKELSERINRALTLGDLDLAEKLGLRLVKMLAESSEAFLNLGNIYTRRKENNQAIKAYQQAVELDPENAEAYNNLGVVYKNVGNLTTAREALETAGRLAPDKGGYFLQPGKCLQVGR